LKIKDFFVGQTVYLKTIGHPYDCWKTEKIEAATVTNVGRKYVAVQIGKPNPHKATYLFDATRDFRQKNDYGEDFRLFPSEQAIHDYWQTRYLLREIRTFLAIHEKNMPVRTANHVAQTLNIPIDGWRREREQCQQK